MSGEGPPELPPLQEALLDESLLRALFDDLRQHARIHAAQVRVDGRLERPDPPEAMAMLAEGRAQAMQVLYTFQGRQWRDTLTRTQGGGVRLVRISAD